MHDIFYATITKVTFLIIQITLEALDLLEWSCKKCTLN